MITVAPWHCPGCSKVHTQTYGVRCQADHCPRCVGHTRGRVVRALVSADVIELFVPAGKDGMGEVYFAHHWWPIVAIRQSCLFDGNGTPKIDVDYRDHGGATRTIAGTSWSKTRPAERVARGRSGSSAARSGCLPGRAVVTVTAGRASPRRE